MHHSIKIATKSLIVLGVAVACMRDRIDAYGELGSGVFSLSTGQGKPVATITDGKSAEKFALENGFYSPELCAGYLRGGEKVWFSGSYGDGEAGQSYGQVVKEKVNGQDVFWYVQTGNSTMQMMLPPGLGGLTGKSRWDLGRYQRFLAKVAFESVGPNKIYDTISAEVIPNLTGGTAGGQVSYGESLKITLNRQASKTQTIIIFVKGQGPRVMEFREFRWSVGASAKVYIGVSS